MTTARAAEGPATRLAAVAWARVRTPYKQVAAVLRAKGRIAVATYRIRLRISTARWIFPLCRTMAGENAPSSGGCGPNVARFLGFQPSLCPKRHLDRFSRLRSAHNCDRQTDRQTHRPRYVCSNNRPQPEASGVQDCMSGTGTPIAYVNSTDVPVCRHSTRL